ncbi:sulfatase-like hydrolase/transferase [Flavobacterium sp. ASW18X]|uniref:sulfatase-like hydrolase/transferase n=1 Tax=Flavobacterium sp. ASW18X TaxID=2572595 RepID=UPI001F0D22BC|nr:sulfatase-like hydrolase/transferase [Flavobacterium sp. ASW18X]
MPYQLKEQNNIKTSLLLFLVIFWVMYGFAQQEKPNIVWITTEDNSAIWLKLYDPENGVSMPNVEALAAEGIVFNNAFSNGAVCSVARSTLISGTYAPRTGSQFHRNAFEVPLPEGLKSYPEYLKEAGYYMANCAKEDYNFELDGIWDDSSKQASYRNRKEGQPFMQVWSLHDTHEGSMHKRLDDYAITDLHRNPKEITVFPYHPNTPTFRKSYAYYYEKHRHDDTRIGELVAQLKEDQVLDNTIIFYYGDHGGVLPRSKGYIYESGLQVPLVVYIPEKWQHLFPAKAGSRVDGFVSFVDFAPTLLNLAGVAIPKQMDGKAFMGKDVSLQELNRQQLTIGHADRFDEKYDLVRSIRIGNYKYIRNYQPFNVDALYNAYRYKQKAYQEWLALYRKGALTATQAAFFKARPVEQLFNVSTDPHEIKNLANSPQFAEKLQELRKALNDKVKAWPDLSFYPESYLRQHAINNPVDFGQKHKKEIGELIAIANLELLPFTEAKAEIAKALKSDNPWKRYWALIVCSAFEEEAIAFTPIIRNLKENDDEVLVRLRAIEYLGLTAQENPVTALEKLLREKHGLLDNLMILNTASLFKTLDNQLTFKLNKELLLSSAEGDKNGEYWINGRIQFLMGDAN